jgi:hypothetical protein
LVVEVLTAVLFLREPDGPLKRFFKEPRRDLKERKLEHDIDPLNHLYSCSLNDCNINVQYMLFPYYAHSSCELRQRQQ